MGIVLWELLTRSDPYDRRRAAAESVAELKPSVLCLRAEMAVQCNLVLSGTIYTVYSNSSSCEQLRRRRQITAAAFDRTRRKKAAGKTVHKIVHMYHANTNQRPTLWHTVGTNARCNQLRPEQTCVCRHCATCNDSALSMASTIADACSSSFATVATLAVVTFHSGVQIPPDTPRSYAQLLQECSTRARTRDTHANTRSHRCAQLLTIW